MHIYDFIYVRTINGGELVLNRSQISSIYSDKGHQHSTITMINGSTFDVPGTADDIFCSDIGGILLKEDPSEE